MSKLLKILLVLGGILFGLAAVAVFMFGPMLGPMIKIWRTQAGMLSAAVYQPTAEELALFCQTADSDISSWFSGNGWMPKPILDLQPTYRKLTRDGARIEMAGGFYHYGYTLARDEEASTPDENVWHLRCTTRTVKVNC